MPRVTRHIPRSTTFRAATMTLEVIERRSYQVSDHQVANDLRQALADDDRERLDELITFLDIDTPHTTDVLDYREVA